jgi:chromosome segregation ATPase
MTKLAFVLDNGRELQIPLAANMPLGRLAEVTAAVQDAEMLHQERMQSLGLVSARHERICSDLAEVNTRYHEISAEVHRLQAIEAELRHELQTLTARNEQSLTALQELSGRRAVEEDHLRSLEEQTCAARQLLRETTGAVETEQEDLKALSEKLSQVREEQAQVHADVAARSEELLETEAKLQTAQTQHDRVVGQRDTLAAACEDLVLGNEQLQTVRAEIEASIASLSMEERTARQAADAADAARHEAAGSLRQTEAGLHARRVELQGLEEQTAAAREALANTEASQTRLTQVLAAQQDRQARLQGSIGALEELLGSRQAVLAATEKNLSDNEQRLAEARDALTSTQQSLNEHEEQLRTKSAELDDKNRKVTTRSEELADLSAMLERRHDEEREAEARLSGLTSQIESFQQQLVRVGQGRAEVEQESDRLAACVDGSRQELSKIEQRLQETILSEHEVSGRLENARRQHAEASSALAVTQEQLATSEKALAEITPRLDLTRQQLTEASTRLAIKQDEHVRLVGEVGSHQCTIKSQQKWLDTMRQEHAEAESQVVALRVQEAAIKSSIEKLAAAEKTQKERYDELHSLTEAAESGHASRMRTHEEQLAHAAQELHEVESRLEALEAWNQRMSECQGHLANLPDDSLEARNLRNDIEVSMAGLRHLLSKRARPVAPPPLHPRTDKPPHETTEKTACVRVSGETLPQERSGMNLRARMQSQAGSAMRENDRQLEDKIRQNEVRLELLERRLKRGELEERRQREKITSLKQQLGDVGGEISGRALVRA